MAESLLPIIDATAVTVADVAFDAAEIAFRTAGEKFGLDPTAVIQYGTEGRCAGPAVAAHFDKVADPTGLFLDVVRQLRTANGPAVAQLMTALVTAQQARRRPADIDGIADAMRSGLLPRLAAALPVEPLMATPDALHSYVYWSQGAQMAAVYYQGHRQVAWVAARCMMAALAGVTPNPFAGYLGLDPDTLLPLAADPIPDPIPIDPLPAPVPDPVPPDPIPPDPLPPDPVPPDPVLPIDPLPPENLP